MKVIGIVQARMGSTRLPGKVMMKIKGEAVLFFVIERVKQSKLIDQIVIATTTNKQDDVIVKEAKRLKVDCFRGSEEDVLSRYYNAAQNYNADVVVRITSDCPLIDPKLNDKVIGFYLENNSYDLVTNAGPVEKRTYPRGLDIEVFSFQKLEEAYNKADKKYQREHVTPYIYENSEDLFFITSEVDYSDIRLTLDTSEDFDLIQKIFEKLYHGKHDFYLKEIINLFNAEPTLKRINQHVEQKKI